MVDIPTRFGIGQTPAGRFLSLMKPQPVQAGLPRATTAVTSPAMKMRGTSPMRLPTQPSPAMMPLQQAVMNQMQRRGQGMGAPAAPKTPQAGGIMGMLPGIGTPGGAGLSAAAARGLQLSGYQDRPITTGQVLGEMMGAGMEAYRAEQKAQQAAEIARLQRETDINLKLMEIGATKSAKTFGQEKDLRKEFTTQSKDFTEARLGLEKVQNAAMAAEPTGASDIALVFGYMKVLDPNSVVREGEFATAANAGGVSETIRNMYNRVRKGTLLTDTVRKQFIASARTQFQPYLQQQEQREASFKSLAGSYDLDPAKVVDSKLPEMGSLSRPHSVSTEDEAEGLPSGSYVMIGGRLARVD